MEAFYHDNSRKSAFTERARQLGPLSGSESCQVELLEWSSGDVSISPGLISTHARALQDRAQPRLQIVFAPLDMAHHQSATSVQAVFDRYAIPSDFISQRLVSVTHSFGANYDGKNCSSWFHFLCKNVTANVASQPSGCADPRKTVISQSDWTWIRTSAFLRWSNCQDKENASAVLVLFSATKKLRDRFQRAWNGDLAEILIDPFSLFAICLDELWMQSQDIVDIARKEFGEMELTALGLAKATATNKNAGNPDFVGLHKMAKHIIYLKEGADAAILILSHLQKFHEKLLARPPQGDEALPIMHLTDQMLGQKAVQFEVWQLRMASTEQRMQNIINLSFNVVTQHDSHILKNDSKSMKAIACVTMAFLPLATFAAVFGSQFFNFDEKKHRITVSSDFWILWALIGPLSLSVSFLYYYLCYFRGSTRDSLTKALERKHVLSP
ncbi:hypothetical protein G7Y79_00031g065390 [Physcia stellaris]|nr:hypothetical protein G7Y79_00031g065390 [Physcia stellaris]